MNDEFDDFFSCESVGQRSSGVADQFLMGPQRHKDAQCGYASAPPIEAVPGPDGAPYVLGDVFLQWPGRRVSRPSECLVYEGMPHYLPPDAQSSIHPRRCLPELRVS